MHKNTATQHTNKKFENLTNIHRLSLPSYLNFECIQLMNIETLQDVLALVSVLYMAGIWLWLLGILYLAHY